MKLPEAVFVTIRSSWLNLSRIYVKSVNEIPSNDPTKVVIFKILL